MFELFEKIQNLSLSRIILIGLAKENHILRCIQHAKPSIRGVVTSKKLKDKKIVVYNFNNKDGSTTTKIVQNGKQIGGLMHISPLHEINIEIKYEETTNE